MIYPIIVSLVVVAAAVILTWREEVGLLFNSEGFRPSNLQIGIFVALFFGLWLLTTLLAANLSEVKRDYEQHLDGARSDSLPPTAAGVDDAHRATIAAYEARGFTFRSRLDDAAEAPEVWAQPSVTPDQNNLHRRTGALVYADGSATQFSVAVLYGDDVWDVGDEVRVRRHQMGRPVTIQTAINRPLIRELIQSNDYVLGIGLASENPTREQERNESLAHARAFNIGFAIARLGLKDATRIHGVSLGHATALPSIPAQEPRQRAVVIVGVNASRDVVVTDVVRAAARLISLEGVNLEQYSRAGAGAIRSPSVQGATRYRRVADVRVSATEQGAWVLPAISPTVTNNP